MSNSDFSKMTPDQIKAKRRELSKELAELDSATLNAQSVDLAPHYNHETSTLIGTTKKELYDPETQQYIHVDQITKRAYGSKNFWKVYLQDFLLILGVFDNKQVDIFIYIARNTDPSTNLFIGTYKKIAKDVGVSEPTIAKIMKKLRANNFIIRVQNGVYRVNPNILMRGDDRKRQILLTHYREDDPKDQKLEISRGKQKPLPTNGNPDVIVPISGKSALPSTTEEIND